MPIKNKKPLNIIFASTIDGGIGYKNTIPWHIKEDLLYFKNTTTVTKAYNKQNAVIMGKNTWFSLKEKPLKNRLNIVISSCYYNNNTDSSVIFINSVHNAINICNKNENIESIFIIGGSKIYNYCLDNIFEIIDLIYMTIINENENKKYDVDTFINIDFIRNNFIIIKEDIKDTHSNYILLKDVE